MVGQKSKNNITGRSPREKKRCHESGREGDVDQN
jgi:hypothetical protein